MAVASALEIRQLDRSEQLKQLRLQMAAVSGKMVPVQRAVGHDCRTDDVLPASESLLPIPESLAAVAPRGLPRGAVAVLSGARSLPVSMVAAATAAGGHSAIVGLPDFGLLAAKEMGADLSRVAMILDPGIDPVEVAAVLMDGMDLVLLGLGSRSVSPTRARAVVARARQKGCTLLIMHGEWQGPSIRLAARLRGYEITGGRWGSVNTPVSGCGRISRIRLSMHSR